MVSPETALDCSAQIQNLLYIRKPRSRTRETLYDSKFQQPSRGQMSPLHNINGALAYEERLGIGSCL
ncbi:MAG: hypothetical protein AB8G05_12895 [Oligoflexales bacterium]